MAKAIVSSNGYDSIITLVQGEAPNLKDLPDSVETVDIIISDWMGYLLMYESRLADVLAARDRWLKKGGLIFPDRAMLHLELLDATAYKEKQYDYFDDVWGFDFSPMKETALNEPVVDCFGQAQLISNPCCVLDLDLHSCTADDCYHMASLFSVTCKRNAKV